MTSSNCLDARLTIQYARGQAISVIRDSTIELAQRLERVKGEKGAGESVVLCEYRCVHPVTVSRTQCGGKCLSQLCDCVRHD